MRGVGLWPSMLGGVYLTGNPTPNPIEGTMLRQARCGPLPYGRCILLEAGDHECFPDAFKSHVPNATDPILQRAWPFPLGLFGIRFFGFLLCILDLASESHFIWRRFLSYDGNR